MSPSFTVSAGGLLSVLSTPARVAAAFTPNPHILNPPPPAVDVNAVWDTGATGSVITQDVINRCGLQPISMTIVGGVHGNKTSPVYSVNIEIFQTGFSHVRVTRGDLGSYGLLIGMDIISKGDFAVTNFGGKTVFSFRCPSEGSIDFGKGSAGFPTKSGVGPNERCPCGSGKKFKKCCGQFKAKPHGQ